VSASRELQTLIFNRLVEDAAVHALIGDRIYDGPAVDAVFPYVSFGPSYGVPNDLDCVTGRVETIQLDIWCRDHGRLGPCRDITDVVKTSLHQLDGSLAINALGLVEVTAVRVFMDQDNITAHGVVTIEAEIEEP
jgi:hypothetical protein